MSVQDDLVKQILAQNTTSRWSGQGMGSAEANARDMARILDSIGITDIKQFGKVPAYEPITITDWKYNGRRAAGEDYGLKEAGTDPWGETIYEPFKLPEGQKATPVYSRSNWAQGDDGGGYSYYSPLSAEEVGQVINKNGDLVRQYSENYGNKLTGQHVPLTYSERQTGNAWGGTFEGSGNTGYRVDFTPDGTPVFYTTGASSSDAGDWLPFLAIAGLGLGLPMLGEAFGAAGAGAAGAGMGAAELAALDLALGGAGGSLGAAELGAALAGGTGGGAGLLEHVFDPTFGGELAPVIGGGAESVFDPTLGESALDAGMNAYPSTGSGLDAGMDAYPNTGNIGSPSSIKPSDIKRALDAASKVTGGNQPTTPGGTAGATGTAIGTDPLSVLQQQASNASLLNLLGSKPELANIKSFKELFGEGLFGDSYVPPSAGGAQAAPVQYADSGTASQNEDEQQLFTGGHVDDFDVDALLQILRS
jgi:hypothetical protein